MLGVNASFVVNAGHFDPDSIMQGELGDCWFLSSMCIAATCEGRFFRVGEGGIIAAYNEHCGIYAIRFDNDGGSRDVFFRSNDPVDIRSDKMFPGWRCGTSSENSRCEKVRNGEFYWGADYQIELSSILIFCYPDNVQCSQALK